LFPAGLYVAWLFEMDSAVEGLVPLVPLAFLWSFAAALVLPPRWPERDRIRMWTTLGWRSIDVVPGTDIEQQPLRFTHFDGEVSTVNVVSRLGRRRKRRLLCTISSKPQEAACARLDVERDRLRSGEGVS
jgi:hypothetical protein